MKSSYETIHCDPHIPAILRIIKKEDLLHYQFPSEIIPAHWHRSLEITLIEHGANIVWCEGEETVIRDDISLVNSGSIHEIRQFENEIPDAIILIIAYEYLYEMIDDFDDMRFDLNLAPQHKKTLIACMHRLESLKQTETKFSYILIHNTINQILYTLCTYFQVVDDQLERLTRRQFQYWNKRLVSYIDEHYEEPLSLEQIADEFAMSKTYFSSQFHARIGVTFREYLNKVRLHYAMSDVIHSDFTIQEIALRHGFANVKSFIATCKQSYGLTPMQYRMKSKEMTISS